MACCHSPLAYFQILGHPHAQDEKSWRRYWKRPGGSSGLRFTNPGSRGELTERFADNYCSFAYSALACFTMGGRAGETECSHGLPTTNYLRPLRTRLPLAILTGKTLAAAEVGCQSIRRNRPHGDQWAPDFGPP